MPSTTTDRLYGVTTSVAVKSSCRVATTEAITLTGEQTIDGVAVVTGDRVLVKDQADTRYNGLWCCQTGDWTRTPDFNGSLDVVSGTLVFIPYGTENGVSLWRCTSSGVIVIGEDVITWEELPLFPGTSALEISINFLGTPTEGQWMGGYIFKHDAVIAADFGGGPGFDAVATVKTVPGSTETIKVKKNGVDAGTISIATSGVDTWATDGGSSISFAEDDQVDLYGDLSGSSAADYCFKFVAAVEE